MKFGTCLSYGRYALLLLPLHGLVAAVEVGCGLASTNALSTSSSLYGAYGHGPHGHYGYYGYYGCTDGYGYDDPTYGFGCDDGSGSYGKAP